MPKCQKHCGKRRKIEENAGIIFYIDQITTGKNLLKDLNSLSLSQLEEKLNTDEVLDMCKHNQEHFRTKPELKKLKLEFSKIFDK